MNENGWIGVDLDGTLAHYDGWKGVGIIGRPIELMCQRVRQWLAEGKEVKIFTARVGGPEEASNALERQAVRDWSMEQFGQHLEVTCKKDFLMEELYDDRAVTVEKNTGRILVKGHKDEAPDQMGSFLGDGVIDSPLGPGDIGAVMG